MKLKYIVPILILPFLESCFKKSNEVEVVKTDLKQQYSELELKGFECKSSELSNREAYRFIYNLFKKDVNKLSAFPEAAQIQLGKAKQFQDLQAQAKGDSMFHKVNYAKVQTDTLSSGVYILDDRDSIVYRRLFK
jgi:hypothetical protein